MTLTLLAALALAVALFFGGNWLAERGIDRWYMNDEAVAERNIGHLRSLCTRPGRIDERIRRIEANLIHQRHCLLELRKGFAGEADDDIRSQTNIRA